MDIAILYVLLISIPTATAASALLPGKFYWRPRLGVFSYPEKTAVRDVSQPTSQNIKDEVVVLIDGYSLGLTIMALSAGYHASKKPLYHLHPRHASYYTNVYRWALRHLHLLQPWLGGIGKYIDTQKAWRRRFYYMEEFVPKWLQRLLPFVSSTEWEEEEKFMKKYKYFAEPAFGKHYYYPTKKCNNFASQETMETVENLASGIFIK